MSSPFPIPLNALRAIEIVARTQALGPAAEELGVTVGAVSQHIKRAEERLGRPLFDRTSAGLVPTSALAEVAGTLSAGFQQLAEASRQLRDANEGILTVTAGNVFASRWLVWRLGRFNAAHPGIELRLITTGKLIDLARGDVDCGIRFGDGHWPGITATPLRASRVRPVCAPMLRDRLQSPADLAHVPVIRDTAGMLSWADWCRAAGLAEMPEMNGPTYSDPSLAFDAAISGQGVLLALDMMTADAVSDGRLARPFEAFVESQYDYWLAVSTAKREPKRVRLLREWLAREIPRSAEGYMNAPDD